MSLVSSADIASYLHGVLGVSADDGGVRLTRFTGAQMRHFASSTEALAIRSRCPSGASIALRTDACTAEISLKLLDRARDYAGIDVEVDGAIVNSVVAEPAGDTLEVPLFEFDGPAMRTVHVYLPQTVEFLISSLSVDGGTTLEPVATGKIRILCLGDSITQGMNARHPASVYTTGLARGLVAEVLNQGVGGHVFDPASFDRGLPFEADIVTVAYGTNDWNANCTATELRNNVVAYVAAIRTRYPKARIIVATPIWRAIGDERRATGTLTECSRVIAEASTQVDRVEVIDGLQMVPHRAEFLPDGTHPNDEGFFHYSAGLCRSIRTDHPVSCVCDNDQGATRR